ncbi:MAG: hypothetical protein F4Y03_14255 [Alphaproteobacteria bacterium]|nr:hypothetical protein [Alphaproteobacteria bacterium]
MARARSFPESMHVTWLGLRSRQDWVLVRRAIDDGYVTVTNNRADFVALIEREPHHPGLVCINVAHGLMSLDIQRRLFDIAMTRIADTDLVGQVLEITLSADRTVLIERYSAGATS